MTLDKNIICLDQFYNEIQISRDTLTHYQIVGSIKAECSSVGIEEPKYIVFAPRTYGMDVEVYMKDFDYDFETYRRQIMALDGRLKMQADCNETDDFKYKFIIR